MRDIAQVFRTLWERAGEFNSVPILTPKLIPLGDYERITSTNLLVRVAHASRVSGEAVSGSRTLCYGFNDTKRLFPRDAETST
jgi:hypothetical protein